MPPGVQKRCFATALLAPIRENRSPPVMSRHVTSAPTMPAVFQPRWRSGGAAGPGFAACNGYMMGWWVGGSMVGGGGWVEVLLKTVVFLR